MNYKILIPILIGIVTVVVFSMVLNYSEPESQSPSEPTSEINFTYSDIDKIKKTLATQNIFMSLPTAITDHTVDQYCTFFDDEDVQQFVKYCTTTALLNSDGQPLGNVNMGGSSDDPIMALAIIEASPFLDSKEDEVDFVFQTMIETLVCDCWEAQQPGGFESVQLWLNAAEKRYVESGQITLKSKITGLAQKQLILEITATEESYLWTLIVLK